MYSAIVGWSVQYVSYTLLADCSDILRVVDYVVLFIVDRWH